MRRVLTLGLAAALLASPAAAHRGHASLSVVEIDAAGRVTVVHRLAAHDVEPALVDLAPRAQPSVDDPDALAALIIHGRSAFRLWDERGIIVLTHAATELAGDDVRLTYAGRLAGLGRELRVDSDLLTDAHADQENQVNIRRARVTRTVVFRPGDEPQTVTFD